MRRAVRWSIWYVDRDLPTPVTGLPFYDGEVGDLTWLDSMGIRDGTPFLLSPRFEYDVALNSYFLELSAEPPNTRENRARALERWLNFLWFARGGRSWRDASDVDHVAFHRWRREDVGGPRVAGSTWSQEVALVNSFYVWAVKRGHVVENPIPQRTRRAAPAGTLVRSRSACSETVPATYAHDERGQRIEWLPAASYRLWRDVGVRGYGVDGLRDPAFKGRWASRNALFMDLMVRTGMRLSEQANLSVLEVPVVAGLGGHQRFWLPEAIVKGSSARWVYVPEALVAELASYVAIDRAEIVADARAAGRYDRIRRPLVIDDPRHCTGRRAGRAGGEALELPKVTGEERSRLLVDTPAGLEPAGLWLAENGMPMSVSTWKSVFAIADRRCASRGVPLSCHAHLLRHTFAVLTLEQLQRGHIAELATLSPAQRGHYTRVFGDPLDWVRRRLGHRSATTTVIYLHALQELEMQTRMALVPDSWDDPRDTGLEQIGDDVVPPPEVASSVVSA